jgi:hypothetical protein
MPFQAYRSLKKSIDCMAWLSGNMHDDWLASLVLWYRLCCVSRTVRTNNTFAEDAYLHVLNEEAFPSPLNTNQDFQMWFQQDGAPVHCSVRGKTVAALSIPW